MYLIAIYNSAQCRYFTKIMGIQLIETVMSEYKIEQNAFYSPGCEIKCNGV